MNTQERIEAITQMKEKNRADSAAFVAEMQHHLARLEESGEANQYVIRINAKNLKIFIDLQRDDDMGVFRPYQASLMGRERAVRLAKVTFNKAGDKAEAIRVGDAMREMIEEEPAKLERHLQLLEETLEELLKNEQQ